MNDTRLVNRKLLRCGYTTGTCAAAASKAATEMLLSGKITNTVSITTPSSVSLVLDVLHQEITSNSCKCAIRKDSGDDPDITNGILVFAEVKKAPCEIIIDGGVGVGRVTKSGLDRPVGDAAINSMPRKMIYENISEVCNVYGYSGGISVIISIPNGDKIAKKTFNPNLGIVGGLSVLGTSGIVEPMSNKALIDSIRLETSVLASQGKQSLLITLGNYGEKFAKESLHLSLNSNIKCSNFICDAIDAAVENGFRKILITGHIGKLSKVGMGIMNTHSSNGDGRIECLLTCALEAGSNIDALKKISTCISTDAVLNVLRSYELIDNTMQILGRRIIYYFKKRVPDEIEIGYVCFTNDPKPHILAMSDNAENLMNLWR